MAMATIDKDKAVINDDLQELRGLCGNDMGRKADLVRRCADLLAEHRYAADPTKVCTALTKILCKDRRPKDPDDDTEYAMCSRAWVFEQLPDEYKRTYTVTPEPTDTEGEVEQWLANIVSCAESSGKVAKSILKDMRKARAHGDTSKWSDMESAGAESLTTLPAHVQGQADLTKEMSTEALVGWTGGIAADRRIFVA